MWRSNYDNSDYNDFNINIKPVTGIDFELETNYGHSIRKIKSLIEKKKGIPVKVQRLFYMEKELDDDQTIFDIGVREGATIQMFFNINSGPDASRSIISLREFQSLLDLSTIMNMPNLKQLISKECRRNVYDTSFQTDQSNESHISDSASDLSDGQFLKENLITMGKMHHLRTKMDLRKTQRKLNKPIKCDISFGEQCANESIQLCNIMEKKSIKCDKKIIYNNDKIIDGGECASGYNNTNNNNNNNVDDIVPSINTNDYLNLNHLDDDQQLFVPFKTNSFTNDIELNRKTTIFNNGRNLNLTKITSNIRNFSEKIRDHYPSTTKWSMYRNQITDLQSHRTDDDQFDRFTYTHDTNLRCFTNGRTYSNIRRSRSFKINGNDGFGVGGGGGSSGDDTNVMQINRYGKKIRDNNFEHFNTTNIMMKSRKNNNYNRQTMHRIKYNEIEYPKSHIDTSDRTDLNHHSTFNGDEKDKQIQHRRRHSSAHSSKHSIRTELRGLENAAQSITPNDEWRFNNIFNDSMHETLKMHSSKDHIRKKSIRSARLVDNNQFNVNSELTNELKKTIATNDKIQPKYWLEKLTASNQLENRKCPNDVHLETINCDLLCRLIYINEQRTKNCTSFELQTEQLSISERIEQQYVENMKTINSKNTAIADQSTFRVLKMTSDAGNSFEAFQSDIGVQLDALTLRCDSPKNVIETFGPTTSECLSITNFHATPIACKLNPISNQSSENSIQLTINRNTFKNCDKYDINWMTNEYNTSDTTRPTTTTSASAAAVAATTTTTTLCDDVKSFHKYKIDKNINQMKSLAHQKQKYRIIKRKDYPNDRMYEEACMREAWLIENYENIHGKCFDDLYEIGSDSDDSIDEIKQYNVSSDIELETDNNNQIKTERSTTPLSIKNQLYLNSLPDCMNTVHEMEKIRSNAYFYSFESMREQEKMKEYVLNTRGQCKDNNNDDDNDDDDIDNDADEMHLMINNLSDEKKLQKQIPKSKPLPKQSDFKTTMDYWDAVYSLNQTDQTTNLNEPINTSSKLNSNNNNIYTKHKYNSDEQNQLDNSKRCAECHKKLNAAITMKCRCDEIFCIEHRLAELHRCSFDFKQNNNKNMK